MSKDIIVLTPNGRRQTIHCTADTSILQILEDACLKHGFQPSDYDLKHHNHLLDLTTTIRFSNLPNKATVEMVEAERKREENNVTIGLLLEDGERRTADFPPHTSLYDLITSLAAPEFNDLQNPCILYMRQEVAGVNALREKTLRKLGLIKGRAILRLLNKAGEAKQANVSAVYRVPLSEDVAKASEKPIKIDEEFAGPSQKKLDPVSFIRSVKNPPQTEQNAEEIQKEEIIPKIAETHEPIYNTIKMYERKPEPAPKQSDDDSLKRTPSDSTLTKENLVRRLNIEEEVIFLGAQKAIAYMQPDEIEAELEDLPDDFYDLTVEEVRKLFRDLQQHRVVLENTPLTTTQQRAELEKQTSVQRLSLYKNAVVRIQFPDRIILQGIFQPTNTIQDVMDFIKEHLRKPEKKFYTFITPLKETLDPAMTLLEARFVPCVHMHFKWEEEDFEEYYLKEDVYNNTTTSEAANILASKYRAPTRRKMDGEERSNKSNVPSTSKNSKMPKWFKN